jgi:hypothetical protein
MAEGELRAPFEASRGRLLQAAQNADTHAPPIAEAIRRSILNPLCTSIAVAITLGIVACERPELSPREKAHAPVAPAAVKPAAQKQPVTVSAAPIHEPDVTALLHRWIAAQNAGDFETYSTLYATRFDGIKRVGQRVHRFDRTSWLRDRKRMFAKSAMHVEALNPEMSVFPRLARVTFEQHWASDSFSDRGEKALIIVRENGALRIEREEMLSSNVSADSEPIEVDLRDFMQVERTRRDYVILAANADVAWGHGVPVLDSNEAQGLNAARIAVKREALPDRLKQQSAATALDLFGASGAVCHARSDELFLLRRFLVNETGAEFHDESIGTDKPSAREIAQAVWDAGAERTLLVAEVVDVDGDCKSALWARASERASPTVFVASDADSALATRVTEQARKLRGYKKLQSAFILFVKENYEDAKDAPQRWEQEYDPKPSIKVWRNGERMFVSYDLNVGGCGDYLGAVWGLFELRDERLLLIADSGVSTLDEDFTFKSVADIDGDGQIEVFGGASWVGDDSTVLAGRARPTKLVFLREVGTALHGCRC